MYASHATQRDAPASSSRRNDHLDGTFSSPAPADLLASPSSIQRPAPAALLASPSSIQRPAPADLLASPSSVQRLEPHHERTEIDQKSYRENREFLSRVSTFADYPITVPAWIKPYGLARAGFYYEQIRDQVRCHFCGLVVRDWHLVTDAPLALHRRFSPNCDFAAETERQERGGNDEEVDGEPVEEEPDQQYGDVDLAENARKVRESKARLRNRNSTDGVETLLAMKKENEEIENQLKCKNCKRERIQTLFLPCRHLVACEPCADQVDFCFYCNTKIMGTVKTFVI